MNLPIDMNRSKIEAFCRKWRIIELSFFGSILRDDFGPDSDVDVLVSFEPDAERTWWDFVAARDELAQMFGREVSLVERRSVERSRNYIRRNHILGTARSYYAEG